MMSELAMDKEIPPIARGLEDYLFNYINREWY